MCRVVAASGTPARGTTPSPSSGAGEVGMVCSSSSPNCSVVRHSCTSPVQYQNIDLFRELNYNRLLTMGAQITTYIRTYDDGI